MYNDNELYHFGVKGMRWGHRKVRGHAGPGKYVTRKRQLAGDKRDLDYLNKGGHLSVGLTKKRQEKFDARDKAALEKRIAKNERKLAKNEQKNNKGLSTKQKKVLKVGAAAVGTALAAYGGYRASQYIKEKAFSKEYAKGQELAEAFRSFGADTLARRKNYNDAERYWNLAKEVEDNSRYRGNKVSRTTKDAVKYLYNNRNR